MDKMCVNIFLGKTSVFAAHTKGGGCVEDEKYYIIKKNALPEVLLKVVSAKRLLESEEALTVQEATEAVGISRSSFYKYKDDIFPFHENTKGKNITFMIQMQDQPGLLSCVLNRIADFGANILTINQAIPINGIALITLSVEILPTASDFSILVEGIQRLTGIHSLKFLARE